MSWLINMLNTIGNWFIGRADELDQLDDKIKQAINLQTKRAFGWGFGLGAAVTIGLLKIFSG